ncbi:hypothetical protein Zmor_019955 [Zophobas morio]|uniref:Gustatory receptor n=1 Tax=Zophobas morio TaxID=2755281 RepID=A0AA38I2H4_9CUCU|nr:hypothetical protein Zmor_019955 [Zophobas morio]
MTDIFCIKPFFYYLNAFLITPWYDFKRDVIVKPNLCKLYATVLISLKLSSLVYLMLDERTSPTYEKLVLAHKILFSFYFSTTITLTILTIVKSSFWNTDSWITMLTTLHHVDLMVRNKEHSSKNFYLKLFVKHAALILCFGYQIFVWSSLIESSIWEMIFLGGIWEAYFEFLSVQLMLVIICSFQNRYAKINELVFILKKVRFVQDLKTLARSYRLLGETVDVFNKIFGWPLVFIIFHCGLQMVYCVNFTVLVTYEMNHQNLMANISILLWVTVSGFGVSAGA